MNPAAQQDTLDGDGGWTYLRDEALAQLNQARQEIKEVDMMLEQSQLEVNRLSQRNAQTTGALQRIQTNFDSVPREDIRLAYEAALDSQQRLFVMRGHLEKMQSDRAHLQQEINLLEQSVSLIEAASSTSKPKKSTTLVESLEMIIQAQEAERQRLSRRMHDGPAQALSNLILQAEIAMRLFETDREKAYEELNSLKDSVTAAVGAAVSVWSVGRIGTAVYGPGARPAVRGTVVFRSGLVALSALFLFCLRTWLFRG